MLDAKYVGLELDLTKCTISSFDEGADGDCSSFIFSLLNGIIYILTLFSNPGYSGVFRAEINAIASTSPSYILSSISTRFSSIPDDNINIGFLGTSEGPQNLFFELWKRDSAKNVPTVPFTSGLELDDVGSIY